MLNGWRNVKAAVRRSLKNEGQHLDSTSEWYNVHSVVVHVYRVTPGKFHHPTGPNPNPNRNPTVEVMILAENDNAMMMMTVWIVRATT